MVAAVSPIQKVPYGVLDARDKFEEFLRNVCDVHRCAPCLTHQAIVFVHKRVTPSKGQRDVYLPIVVGVDKTEHLRRLHATLGRELVRFYDASDLRIRSTKTAVRMRSMERNLLKRKQDFMTTKWYRIITKKRIDGELRKACVAILSNLSDYLDDTRELDEARTTLMDDMAHNAVFKRLMEALGLEEHTTAKGMDVESVTKVIEHVERELETYSVNSSTVVSAVLGGVVGSVLGILVSFAIGFLH